MELKEKDFIQNSMFFIVTDSKLDRSSWKKALNDLGAKPAQLILLESFEQALEKLSGLIPSALIVNYEIKEQRADELLEAFRNAFPNRAESLCILMSEDSGSFCRLAALEHFVDGVVKKPFTGKDLNAKLESLIKEKTGLSKFEIAKHKAFENLQNEEYEKVAAFCDKAQKRNSKDQQLQFLKAQCLKRQGSFEEALALYRQALDNQLNNQVGQFHYHALSSLFELLVATENYDEAFARIEEFMERFPLHPNKLQSYVKASIMTKNYQAIVDYAKGAHHFALVNKPFGQKLAAALAICAKSLAQTNSGLAVEANVKAIKLGREKKRVVEMGLKNLLELRQFELVNDLVEELWEEKELAEILSVAQYRALEEIEENPSTIFKAGMDLTNKGLHDFYIYDLLIKSAVKVGRKKEYIMEMADNACKHHPGKKAYFKSLVAG
ncbi:MAG: hypothetical protein WEB87_00215 [Bacteriovoracaceae bacterium]